MASKTSNRSTSAEGGALIPILAFSAHTSTSVTSAVLPTLNEASRTSVVVHVFRAPGFSTEL